MIKMNEIVIRLPAMMRTPAEEAAKPTHEASQWVS